MQSLSYKLVLDKGGSFNHLELIQNGNVIVLSLAGKGTHENGYRWENVKGIIDSFQKKVYEEVQFAARLNSEESDGSL